MFRPVFFSRRTEAVSETVTDGRGKPAACGLPESNDCCAASSVFPDAANRRSAAAPLMLAARMPDPASPVSKLMGTVSPAFGERPHVGLGIERALADRQTRAAVLRPGGELEGHAVVALAGQRFRSGLLQFGNQVIAGEPFARRAGKPPFELLRSERLHVRARL